MMRILIFFCWMIATDAFMSSKVSKIMRCKQLFGEWQIRYSDDPRFPGKSASIGIIPETGMNRVRVSVYPDGHFHVAYRFYRGLLMNEILQKGRYHIRERVGSRMDMSIRFQQSQESMVSFCGIAIDDLRPVLRNEDPELFFHVEAELIKNEMFLMAKNDNASSIFYYHLIRSDTLHQPTVQVPLSNLIFSNILSMMFTYFIHYLLHVS